MSHNVIYYFLNIKKKKSPEGQSVGGLAQNNPSSDNQVANDDENERPINTLMKLMKGK